MYASMKFMVRYCSSRLPDAHRDDDGSLRWVDYSLHPASKLGLHNAMLAVHDRLDILQAHGGQYECAIFVLSGETIERLSQEKAVALFAALPRGEVKWLAIRDFLLPPHPEAPLPTTDSVALPPAQQLPLFAHVHTPYDDLDADRHTLDVDV
jgi:hypothetical protein